MFYYGQSWGRPRHVISVIAAFCIVSVIAAFCIVISVIAAFLCICHYEQAWIQRIVVSSPSFALVTQNPRHSFLGGIRVLGTLP